MKLNPTTMSTDLPLIHVLQLLVLQKQVRYLDLKASLSSNDHVDKADMVMATVHSYAHVSPIYAQKTSHRGVHPVRPAAVDLTLPTGPVWGLGVEQAMEGVEHVCISRCFSPR
jgi:hypothetical protein